MKAKIFFITLLCIAALPSCKDDESGYDPSILGTYSGIGAVNGTQMATPITITLSQGEDNTVIVNSEDESGGLKLSNWVLAVGDAKDGYSLQGTEPLVLDVPKNTLNKFLGVDIESMFPPGTQLPDPIPVSATISGLVKTDGNVRLEINASHFLAPNLSVPVIFEGTKQ